MVQTNAFEVMIWFGGDIIGLLSFQELKTLSAARLTVG